MSIELKDIELIDRYLSGGLDAASKEAFNTRLQSDASLQQLLSDFQSTNELVKANELAQVKAQLDSFSYDSPPWWQSNLTKYLAVAGVAAVVTTAVWMSSSEDKPAPAKEKNTVIQSASPKEQQTSVVQPKEVQPAPLAKSDKDQSTDEDQFVDDFINNTDWAKQWSDHHSGGVAVPDNNSAPVLSPVPTPAGPAALPPQQDPVVSPSVKEPTADSTTKPGTMPAATDVAPVKKDFLVQLPNQYMVYPDHMKNGNLHIVNESGAVMNDITINASSDSWNGTDRYGNTVPSGLYFYQYTDATSGQTYTGTITVVY